MIKRKSRFRKTGNPAMVAHFFSMPYSYLIVVRKPLWTVLLMALAAFPVQAQGFGFCKYLASSLKYTWAPYRVDFEPYGGLQGNEVSAIQRTVNAFGRGFRLYVVGSAASNTRNPSSDIDYVVERKYLDDPEDLLKPRRSRLHRWLRHRLPDVDFHGVLSDSYRPEMGPAILFEAFQAPRLLTGP